MLGWITQCAQALDQKGHGDSYFDDQGLYNTAHFAADIDAFVAATRATRLILVGASLGTTAALGYTPRRQVSTG